MPSPGKLEFQNGQLIVSGDWTLPNYGSLKQDVQNAVLKEVPDGHSVNLATINALDTAGASLLVDLLGAHELMSLPSRPPNYPANARNCCAWLPTRWPALKAKRPSAPTRSLSSWPVLAKTSKTFGINNGC